MEVRTARVCFHDSLIVLTWNLTTIVSRCLQREDST